MLAQIKFFFVLIGVGAAQPHDPADQIHHRQGGENEHTHILANAHHLGGGIIGRGRRLIGRLIGLLIIALPVRVLLIVLVHLVLPLFLKNVQHSAPIAYHTWH